ncbi:hypothetical protein PROFUN_01336 [Planoprotostelium fungivorum]|uniref:PH domain-containing protein n=1 Tax=Planoprotostelium fungivorum TaxID=1890364 RepID=A0A2P6NZS5_9EUKA|nr:hypothetical protein PROFUN_01336 [Planoprotostelium fungivorum]
MPLILNYSGSDGSAGSDGQNGRDAPDNAYGKPGESGSKGSHGTDGNSISNVDIWLTYRDEDYIVINDGKEEHVLKMEDDVTPEVEIVGRGGRGGKGGEGGRGGNGMEGIHGDVATQFSPGGDGSNGGSGGWGGEGGNGGRGGDGTDVRIHVNEEETELLLILGKIEIKGGMGGECGRGGEGGRGSKAGQAGEGLSWDVMEKHTDETGKTKMKMVKHKQPPGKPGLDGGEGVTGEDGVEGEAGRDGTFLIMVHSGDEVKEYTGRFMIECFSYTVKDTLSYGVIEPGSTVQLSLKVRNNSKMPTPKKKEIMMRCIGTRGVEGEYQVQLPKDLQPGQECVVDVPPMKVSPPLKEGRATDSIPYQYQAEIRADPFVPKINGKFLPNICKFSVDYPLEITSIGTVPWITRNSEAPFVFAVSNSSDRCIGVGGDTNRRVRLCIRADERLNKEDFSFLNEDGLPYEPTKVLESKDVSLAPRSRQAIACSLKFNNENLLPYSRYIFRTSLELSSIEDDTQMVEIQSYETEIQWVEEYVPNPEAQLLLVVNRGVEADEMRAWKSLLIDSLGLEIAVWNTMVYNDLDVAYKRVDGASLLSEFRKKTIVFLNTDNCVDEFTRANELYRAAKKEDIHVVVYGHQWSVDNELRPDTRTSKRKIIFERELDFLAHLSTGRSIGSNLTPVFNANDTADCCGVLSANGVTSWVNLHMRSRVMCCFDSGNRPYPSLLVSLHDVILVTSDDTDKGNQPGFAFMIIGPDFCHRFEVVTSSNSTRKTEKYKHRTNYSEGAKKMIDLLSTISAVTVERFEDILQQEGDSWGPLKVKRGDKVEMTWCVLNPFWGLLCYYPNQSSKVPSGALIMSQYSLEIPKETKKTTENNNGGMFGFLFEPWDSEFRLIHNNGAQWTLISKNQKSRDGWTSAIASLFTQDKTSLLRPPRWEPEVDDRDVVVIIPLEDKYLMSTPTKADLEKRHEALKTQLRENFPAVGAVVLQQWNVGDNMRKRGLNTWHFGNLEIHPTLSPDTASLIHFNVPSDVGTMSDPKVIHSSQTLFCVIKSLHFSQKLIVLQRLMQIDESQAEDRCHAEMETPMGLTILSVLSDIADEQLCIPHTERKMEPGETFDLHKLRKLCQLRDFLLPLLSQFPTPESRFFSTEGHLVMELGTHLLIMAPPGSYLHVAVQSVWSKLRVALGAREGESREVIQEAIQRRRQEWVQKQEPKGRLQSYSTPTVIGKRMVSNCGLLRAQQVSGRRGDTMLTKKERVERSVVERANAFDTADDRKAALATLLGRGTLSGQVSLQSQKE